MTIEIEPILNEPALVITGRSKALVIADIHLGIEWDLYNSGFSIPSQLEQRLDRIKTYIEQSHPDRIVLLGDIKHNAPQVSWQERDEVPYFINSLAKYAKVDVFPGNHDGGIGSLLSPNKNVTLHPSRGAVVDGVGYFHGHTWPDPEILFAEHVIVAHNHPTVRLTDELGYSSIEPVWIRTRFNEEIVYKHFNTIGMDVHDQWNDPPVLVIPAFNELCGGVAFNEVVYYDLLGPMFVSQAIELDRARIYLLDGTELGMLKNIRKLDITKKTSRSGRRRRRPKGGTKW